MAASTKDKLQTVLSEVRNLVLGAQILLGFQYQAAFQPRFESLSQGAKGLEVLAFVLMTVTVACLIAPSSFHRISETGHATQRQLSFTKAMIAVALVPFILSIGANVIVATGLSLGMTAASVLGILMAGVAAFFWFGIEFMHRSDGRERARDGESGGDENVPLKERVNELLTESRIVLPGAQALLGFQFAAFLTDGFEKLSFAAKAAHTASLLLVGLAMILLMTPAPYHRLVENGENTEHFERVGVGLVLASLIPLSLGIAGDFYVVLEKVSGSPRGALAGALAVAAAALGLWFGVPLLARRRAGMRLDAPATPGDVRS